MCILSLPCRQINKSIDGKGGAREDIDPCERSKFLVSNMRYLNIDCVVTEDEYK